MSTLFKVVDAARVMLQSGNSFFSLMKKGASIASTRLLHNCSHYIPQLNTILDVGANKGQFALAAAQRYPDAVIHSFEPVPDTFAELLQNTRKTPAIHTHNFALGSCNGMLEFYSNSYSHASSALQVSELQQQLIPRTANARKIEVAVRQMDSLLGHITFRAPVLLKLDVQGFEKEVLLGAEKCIPQIDYLVFETSFVRMYEGEPLFDEMHHFVKEQGFELIAPVGYLQSDNLQILQMDLLYRRKRINGSARHKY
ncbi:FkbM family methyltransferase [Chitinophaga solisilvae]|uniref:FkbM family methyltransferase n=1 Tax=Chitinophaga solisilvae TaxID=1233460 RepID=A0A3S1D1Z1_9BACT|nr:FkbM family methyltransferase [Chitinophaga solisilvae]NSL85359.1 FkbM family methyltransferase [Chitinophaga solisilvae]